MSTALLKTSEEFMQNNIIQVNDSVLADLDLPECPICHCEFGVDDPAIQITGITGCSHIFGRSYLADWFSSNNPNVDTCPLCRTKLYRGNGTRGRDETHRHQRCLVAPRAMQEARRELNGARQREVVAAREAREAEQRGQEMQEQLQNTVREGQEARRSFSEALEALLNDLEAEGGGSEAERERLEQRLVQLREIDQSIEDVLRDR
ncbi:uncharacterized protein BDZ99DRAFT_528009 [Mytilinidion resinicola]|uniref:RING-type domain-containing protein n=1 Tax=Mytilinidion resinicola TaxID=574789 RepID=A0A6A6XZ55_9PEZI|nr:uncharacterized protein BDZ99DRAFT_528009 [Mytilinidion resinicola]KAF2801792.1 hypothetical protein BDZ99DRAFT_528009 [Mytilinidion resinicola]